MLDELITRAALEDYAGSKVFQRGEAYFSGGAVSRLRATDGKIAAKVAGTETYRVELRDDGGELAYDCTCPHAADGYFCKHCVAVGLAWLSERTPARKSGSGSKQRRDPWRDIEAYLGAQPQSALVALLLEVAQRDDRLYRSLLLKAERAGAGGNVAVSFRRAIDDATRIRGFVDWHDTATFAGDIGQVADSLAELLEPVTAAALVELAEYAIERIEQALEQIDDSDGEVSDIVFRLGGLHLKACAMARPDPAGLAARLFRFETTLPFGLCDFDIATYRDVLGEQGVRRYRELAQAEWRKFEPRRSNDRFDVRRAAITRVMERLAEADGDVEQLVAIKSRDLSSAYCYLGIAEIWAKAKQPDKALEWAERGLKAFPGHPDNRLRDFLVAAYLKRKRSDEALQLTWAQFDERPTLEHYIKLHDVAGKLRRWPAQRERALVRVGEAIARVAAAPARWGSRASGPDCTLRVEIALWEDDPDAAWTAAHQGTCDRHFLVVLASKLEASRPGDAVSLYRRVVPAIVDQTGNAAYEEAIGLIRKVGRLMKAQKQTRQFGDYLAELRAQFKPKRNFIKLLDGVARTIAVS